jgi:hypothetical protein
MTFYFFNHHQTAQNNLQYLAPSPPAASNFESPLTPKINFKYFSQSKASHLHS